MKTSQRQLSALSKMVNIGDFYCITLYEYELKLQGRFSSSLTKSLLNKRFKSMGLNNEGYATLLRGNIEVTLT